MFTTVLHKKTSFHYPMAKFPIQQNSYTLRCLAKSQTGLEGHEFKAVKKAIMQLWAQGIELLIDCLID